MSSRIFYGVAVLALAAVLFSGCSSSGSYLGNPGGPKVGIVGDSITNLMKPALKATVGAKYHYIVKARNGKRIDQQLGELRSILHADDPPRRLIVNLGTNDVLQERNDAVAHLEEELQLVVNVPCVILVTINPNAQYGKNDLAGALNDALRAAVRSHPNFHLLDWAGLLAANPQGAKQWLSSEDALHPTTAGQQVLADQYRTALDQDCAAVPTTT